MQHFSWGLMVSVNFNQCYIPPHEAYNLISQHIHDKLNNECKCGLDAHYDLYEVLCTHDLEQIASIIKTTATCFVIYTTGMMRHTADIDVCNLKGIRDIMRKRIKMTYPPMLQKLVEELARTNDKLNVIAEELDQTREELKNMKTSLD